MSDVKLGELIYVLGQRDAIHMAVAPVVADHDLKPGQHVGFVRGGKSRVGARADTLIGIVDPFLKDVIFEGERFWLLLYPQTITSLRHDWTHPAFTGVSSVNFDTTTSIRWLHDLADEIGISYPYLMESISKGYISTGDQEMYGLRDSEDIERHYKNATGITVGPVHFRCAC